MEYTNNDIQRWAVDYGVPTPYAGAVGFSCSGYDFAVGYVPGFGVALSAVLADKVLAKPVLKSIKSALKPLGKLRYTHSFACLQLALKPHKDKTFAQVLHMAADVLAMVLAQQQLMVLRVCVSCGLPQTDAAVEIAPGVLLPIHTTCNTEQTAHWRQLMGVPQGKVWRSLLLALWFGVIATLCCVALMILQPFYTYWAVVLIPIGMVFGYIRGKAPYKKVLPVLLLLVAVLFAVAAYFGYVLLSPYIVNYYALYHAGQLVAGKPVTAQILTYYPQVEQLAGVYTQLFPQVPLGKGLSFFAYAKVFYWREFLPVTHFGDLLRADWLLPQLPELIIVFLFVLLGVFFCFVVVEPIRTYRKFAGAPFMDYQHTTTKQDFDFTLPSYLSQIETPDPELLPEESVEDVLEPGSLYYQLFGDL